MTMPPLIRRDADRGRFRNHWLDARFSFSFGAYRSRPIERFGRLIALNEDFVQPDQGFGMHPHRDLEIFMVPLVGAIRHADSLGRQDLVHPGSVQHISAGRGIEHSQINASATDVDRHLQIWFEPITRGGEPIVEQRDFDPARRVGRWQWLVSPDGREGSFELAGDASLRLGAIRAGAHLPVEAQHGRSRYLHVIDGTSALHGLSTEPLRLAAGDGIALWQAAGLDLAAGESGATVLVFDVEPVAPPA